MDLDWRQPQLVDDVRVLDLRGLVHRPPLEPLGGEARGGDGTTAAECLELGVLDDPGVEVDLDLQLHDVAAFRCADQYRPVAREFLGEGPDIARVAVVIDNLVAVSHGMCLGLLTLVGAVYSDFQCMDFRSTPSFANS